MIFDKQKIRDKLPHLSKIRFRGEEASWDNTIKLLDTHPEELINVHPEKLRYYLKSAHKRPSLEPWAKSVISNMQTVFHQNEISLIGFLGFGKNTDSYPWHKDKMDVFLVQVQGSVNIKVENTLSEQEPILFSRGDCVYIPRGTHHHIIPSASRVTFSFGVEGELDPSTYV